MASVAIMAGGAILNAAAFIGGNYLAKLFGGADKALEEKKRHDLALEKYEKDYQKYNEEREKLQDWIDFNFKKKQNADESFAETDSAIKLYNQAHGSNQQLTFEKQPKFSDYFQPSDLQKQSEMLFVSGGAAALAVAAFKFL